jgi:SAM-dependent methyltransferase
MKNDYWVKFWQDYGKDAAQSKDEQTQVLRTYNKQPITPELWEFTYDFIEESLRLEAQDDVLDLCAGNGLISKRFAEKCKSVVSVDISPDLIHKIDTDAYPNIRPVNADIRDAQFEDGQFSKVIIYAGLQYLNHKETIELFQKVYRWLRPGGLFFLGDLPDAGKKWVFFNTPERQAVHFQNILEDKAIVGTWFEPDFLEKLAGFAGFSRTKILPQHEDMIYAKFRYDMLIEK